MSPEEAMSITPTDFIREAVKEDLKSGRFTKVHTRFPPEPNGYLHIGHTKALIIDFGIAQEFGGLCNLRYDDTNPTKEDVEYVDAIKEDIRWLGFSWDDREFYASDYFEQLYQMAVKLIKKGQAYVDDQTPEEVSTTRGTLTEPGTESPWRNRSVEENLDLFERMKHGEFPDGSCVLRAKIDMASGNFLMRDPVMYRIIHEPPHHRTGSQWCIYPMYDFAHGQSDSIEGVTFSLCSLEYEIHRPLYEWFLQELEIFAPRQIEFARLNMNYTVMSKRKLRRLVEQGFVSGWDDARMPTLRGLRRRGYTAEAIHDFIKRVGIAKSDSVVDMALLEACLREDLNKRALRRMAVLRPIKLVIDNYPDDQVETMDVINNPEDASAGTRKLPFSRVLYIEQEDFQEVPPPKYYRLFPGNEVRLRAAYVIKCTGVVKDDRGNVIEVHATYDPATRGGDTPDGRKIKSTLHWVSAAHAIPAEVRLYDRLFNRPDPEAGEEGFLGCLNPNSLTELKGCQIEGSLAGARPGDRFQFERQGYFCADTESTPDRLIFNLAVALRDTWAKIEQKQK
jgi:glutaminyl-tRNA synthetase